MSIYTEIMTLRSPDSEQSPSEYGWKDVNSAGDFLIPCIGLKNKQVGLIRKPTHCFFKYFHHNK